MTIFKRLFLKKNPEKKASNYAGFSDFLLRASVDERKKILTQAVQKANEEQLSIFQRAKAEVR